MMEPNPASRPTADEILMHPRLQKIMNNLRGDTSLPSSTTDLKQSLPSKRGNMKLSKLQLEYSPIVEKFKNLSTTRSCNAPLSPYTAIKNEMILISPRALLSA